MRADPSLWRGRRVLVTGHTGFKGAWLCTWLDEMQAKVAGLALDPPTAPSLFAQAEVGGFVEDHRVDIRDAAATRETIARFDPEVLFHLAAQPLVRESYRTPVETVATNVVGTASVLEACRHAPSLRAAVIITTDKCYENREWDRGYVETDALGGHDPYSSSKAAAEIVTASFRRSFFEGASPRVGIATARAGNVVGGGDWAADRLVPDLVRAAAEGRETLVRNPGATRPWQHVLEPLHGYLLLAEALLRDPAAFSSAWNFGPDAGGDQPVSVVIEWLAAHWDGRLRWRVDAAPQPHEAGKLMLDSAKAHEQLGWRARLSLDETLRLTAQWYGRALAGDADLAGVTRAQVRYYSGIA